ncbi:hypothetical protein TNCV_4359151 [Trichonephila clavipes]|uniref:Uncharacterized protein n=1 Tax=Trichonephila clavipes TaxID=2585209 RepID=A0A8X7BH63_TRICX|nr:hypothetical protein TNCV_4359151 [Trichonephila clavipes]
MTSVASEIESKTQQAIEISGIYLSYPDHIKTTKGMQNEIKKLHYKEPQGLLATDFIVLNLGEMKRITPELTPSIPNCHTNGRTLKMSDLTCSSPFHMVGTRTGGTRSHGGTRDTQTTSQ